MEIPVNAFKWGNLKKVFLEKDCWEMSMDRSGKGNLTSMRSSQMDLLTGRAIDTLERERRDTIQAEEDGTDRMGLTSLENSRKGKEDMERAWR